MRFVTYNIHYGVGRDGRVDLDRIAEAVDGADVIALQEVERFWPRSGMTDQPKALGKRLPEYWWVYGPNVDLHSARGFPGEAAGQRRQFGNMILSRTPLMASENIRLPRPLTDRRSMRRGALEAIVHTARGGLRVVSTHLCYLSADTRRLQVEALFDRQRTAVADGGAWDGEHPADPGWYLGDEPTMPHRSVVFGDMNFGPDDPEYESTIGNGQSPFVDVWPRARPATSGATKDGERIDHAWVTLDLVEDIVDAQVDTAASGSDHLPVWFTIDV